MTTNNPVVDNAVAALNPIDRLLNEVRKVIVGYEDVTEKLAYCLFGDGHVLLESVPGLAKTMMVRAFHAAIDNATSNRIQMTPNLLPPDIIGGQIFNAKTQEFQVVKGPAFANLLLADELNRATPKAQSALLEAMAERRVSIAGETFILPDPFVVCATMNPIEQEGTYPLPEAQLDRFMFKIRMGYVSAQAELGILQNVNLRGRNPLHGIDKVLKAEEIVELREYIRHNVYVSPALSEYVVKLVRSTRPECEEFAAAIAKAGAEGQVIEKAVQNGGSPRAMQALVATAAVRAFHRGRDYVLPEDVKYVAPDVLYHRILLKQKAKQDKSFGGASRVVNMVLGNVDVVSGNHHFVKQQS